MINKKTLSLLFFILSTTFLYAQPSAYEIVKRAHDNMEGLTSEGKMKMTIIRPSWKRTIEMKSWSKGTDYSMVLITVPAKDKGQVFMKRKKEMWNWVPSINRMVKLPPSMMSQGWMGSDYTNDDMINQGSIVTGYTHKLTGSKTIDNHECYTVELTPKEETAVVWGKIVMNITQKHFVILQSTYLDEDMEPVRSEKASRLTPVGKRMVAKQIDIVPADKQGEKTVVEIISIVFDKPISESFFSIQKMKSLR